MIDGSKTPIDIGCKDPKIAIEIDGCVWHKCPEHGNYHELNKDFQKSIDKSVKRDRLKDKSLKEMGYKVFRFWEHTIHENLPDCVNSILSYLGEETNFDKSYSDIQQLKFEPFIQDLIEYDQESSHDKEYFTYHRKLGLPYYFYSEEKRISDFQDLFDIDSSVIEEERNRVSIHSSKRVGEKVSKHFMPHIWQTSRKNKKSAKDKWEDDDFLKWLIQNRKEYASSGVTEATLRTGLKLHCGVPKIFPSVLAKYLTERFTPEEEVSVFDPSAGWGSRMVGTLASDNRNTLYVGNDPWKSTYQGLNEIKSDLELSNQVVLFGEPFEDLSKPFQAPFDFVLTSPPHFDKEHYCDDSTQSDVRYNSYSEWKDNFFRPLFSKSYKWLKKNRYASFHITDVRKFNLIDDAKLFMEDIGFTLQDDIFWSRHNVFKNDSRSERIITGRK